MSRKLRSHRSVLALVAGSALLLLPAVAAGQSSSRGDSSRSYKSRDHSSSSAHGSHSRSDSRRHGRDGDHYRDRHRSSRGHDDSRYRDRHEDSYRGSHGDRYGYRNRHDDKGRHGYKDHHGYKDSYRYKDSYHYKNRHGYRGGYGDSYYGKDRHSYNRYGGSYGSSHGYGYGHGGSYDRGYGHDYGSKGHGLLYHLGALIIPKLIHDIKSSIYSSFFYGYVDYPSHGHRHAIYRFPASSHGGDYRPYAYCEGRYFATGSFDRYGGPRF